MLLSLWLPKLALSRLGMWGWGLGAAAAAGHSYYGGYSCTGGRVALISLLEGSCVIEAGLPEAGTDLRVIRTVSDRVTAREERGTLRDITLFLKRCERNGCVAAILTLPLLQPALGSENPPFPSLVAQRMRLPRSGPHRLPLKCKGARKAH